MCNISAMVHLYNIPYEFFYIMFTKKPKKQQLRQQKASNYMTGGENICISLSVGQQNINKSFKQVIYTALHLKIWPQIIICMLKSEK